MSVTPGTRLGPYEIQSALGAGEMGEVYRATDTNLKRAVAIKVLPASVAADIERLQLVVELVEGPTLADRIAQGAIPLPIAQQIAEALESQTKRALKAFMERYA